MTLIKCWNKLSLKERSENAKCWTKITSDGLRNNCHVKFVTGISNTIANTVKLQKTGLPKTIQPIKSIASNAMGTRLLRRLSKIFQRESAERGFLWILRSEPGTNGVHQLAICQSPLIHLCRL